MGNSPICVGIHSSPFTARVVESLNPCYCIFGETVNITAGMESNSKSMRIQCSDRAAEVLKQQVPKIQLESRGLIPIKGKGAMMTFFIKDRGYEMQEQAL
jgi:class 3 adenylate cyclase